VYRKILPLILVSFIFVVATPAIGSAAGACAPAASGFVLYPITGEPGDPAPLVDGAEPLWDDTAVGPFIELFGSFQDGLDALGFADADELYTFVLSGCWAGTATAIRTCASRTSPTPTAFPR